MPKNMLIDTTHAEETRVVVLNGSRVEEFDFESHARKQLRGNIYLAKVTRVEPSLQAAFVEYGGNRHGFLAFNEIHPDYYQIPVADRERLMAELAETAAANAAHDDDHDEEDGGDDLPEEERRVRQLLARRYKIQEVIKRRQIMLVQVVKEERGNKGAALTSYLSLAGRYCVLMPNTGRGGGISRKITHSSDRKRLKGVVAALDVPHGMGLIVRTAGAKRTRQEIKRDYDYLLRVWEKIRETTLSSNAPALIYEEEDLVKRAIRDLFDKDVENILVEGEEGFKSAREFMRMIMPSQARKIQLYRGNAPLFGKYGVEDHLADIYSPVVSLRSGGYLVINQTEALVAIDVNSGKSTKERNIEATALKTNLEAAEEAARQMRLRDLAGLVVIDFIDMDEPKNNRAVEKKLKDALVEDRARIQMGKISGFGLMEISRQRRRTGVLESTTVVCPHCEGMGRVRSVDSAALSAMRAIDLEAMQNGAGAITIKLPTDVALYILNEKQAHLARLRTEWGLKVVIEIDSDLKHTDLSIVRTIHASEVDFVPPVRPEPEIDLSDDYVEEDEDEAEDDILPDNEDEDESDAPTEDSGEGRTDDREGGRNGRRRRRRGGRDRDRDRGRDQSESRSDSNSEASGDEETDSHDEDDNGDFRRRRRRGRRGGRRAAFDARPREPYGWLRARTPSLEEPYVWIDAFEVQQKRFEQTQDGGAFVAAPAAAGLAPLGEAVTQPVSLVPDQPDGASDSTSGSRRQRPPRNRRRGQGADKPIADTATAAVDAESAPEPEVTTAEAEAPVADERPARRTRRRKSATPADTASVDVSPAGTVEDKTVEGLTAALDTSVEADKLEAPTTKPAPEPVSQPAATPSAEPVGVVAEPDPAEILTPPEKPRRGWWRK